MNPMNLVRALQDIYLLEIYIYIIYVMHVYMYFHFPSDEYTLLHIPTSTSSYNVGGLQKHNRF